MRVALCTSLALWLAAVCFSTVGGQRACDNYESCVSFNECPALARLASKKHNLSETEKAQLRSALCGWLPSKQPKVCCPIVPLDECGPQNTPDKIIGGNRTFVKEVPWVARLGYRFRGELQYRCGGALISDRYVLTAAHCVADRQKPVSVRLGEHDTESELDCTELGGGQRICAGPVVDIDVERITSHPEYESNSRKPNGLWNDVALLRLKRPVQFTSAIKPVCLPLKMGNEGPKPESQGFTLTVVGWGKIGSDAYADTSRYLMKLSLRAMRHAECADKYRSFPNKVDDARQLCGIGKHGQDVCSGDSGGPLSTVTLLGGKVRSVIKGIVSFGPTTCATNGVPAVFSRVSYYVPWILDTMRTSR